MAEINNLFVQVPVINKTESLFKRDPIDPDQICPEISPEFKELLATQPYIITAKTDGTCGILCKEDTNKYVLMRRQDIRVGTKNHEIVMKSGQCSTYAGTKCYVTQITRGTRKSERTVSLYIFQLTDSGMPEIEHNHVIGFTPLLADFGDDKNVITSIDGINGDPNMKLYTTIYDGSFDIPVRSVDPADLMQERNLMTVEILGLKVSNKYGFTDNRHLINPHGSIIYPEGTAPLIDHASIKAWFENDSTNRWANVEGFVIHFPLINKRIKVHRGHVGLEKTWQIKKESGIQFIWA